MLPRIQPFSLLGGAVDARDIVDFPGSQRRALLERFENHLAEIDSRVRCVTENQAFRPNPTRTPRFEGAAVNCDPAVDLAGESRVLLLTMADPARAVIGAWGLSGIQILVGAPNYEIEAVPSPALPRQSAGAQIWGRPNTQQWSRVVQDIMQEFFDITIGLDGGETLTVVQWKVPARARGVFGWGDPQHGGWWHGTGPAFDITPHTQPGHHIFKKV